MRTISVLLLTAFTWMGSLGADLIDFYVTNNQGTVGSPGTFISIVDLANNKVEGYVDCTGYDLTHPIDIHISSDGTKAYITCDAVNSVYVVDISLNKVIGKVDDTLNPFNAPAVLDVNLNVTPNIGYVSNEAGSTGNQGSISIINFSVDLVTGKVDDTLGPVDLPIGVGISDDGTKLYVANLNGHNVTIVDTATNAATGYVNDALHPFVQPILIGWSASTKAYISDANNNVGTGFVNVVAGNTDAVTGQVTTTGFPAFVQPTNILEGPDGTMYITDLGNNNVYVVDPTTDAVTAILTGTFSAPLGIAITSDNKTAYIANSGNNTVSIVDVATKTQTGLVDASGFPFFGPYQMQILPVAPPPGPVTTTPLRPICIQGKQKNDRFATQSEFYNTISWCASPSQSVTQYRVYRDGILIETINPNGNLSYEEHDVTGTILYSVTAVNASGVESPAVTVSLP